MAQVIVVAGLARSGKDTFADYLAAKYGFAKHVFSDVLRAELERRGAAVSKQAMADLGTELRRKFGADVVARRLAEKVGKGNAVLVGPRNIEEIDYVRKAFPNIAVVRVDAPKEVRYSRRSGLDAQQIELFFRRDEEDIRGKGLDRALEAAEYVVENSGSLKNFKGKIDSLMGRILVTRAAKRGSKKRAG